MLKFRHGIQIMIMLAAGTEASATTVCVSGTLSAPINTAWASIRDFGGHADWIDGHPDIKLEGGTGTTVGVRRITTFHDGLRFDEVLTALDDRNHVIGYDVVGHLPIPAIDVRGTIRLAAITANDTTWVERCLDYETSLPQSEAQTFRASRANLLAESLKLLAKRFEKPVE